MLPLTRPRAWRGGSAAKGEIPGMGVSVHYVAIPPSSNLYSRAQKEKPIAVLMGALFAYGSTIYRFFEIEAEEREEIFAGVMEDYPDTFCGAGEGRRWLREFGAELERTRVAFPGIEKRYAWLEKTSEIVEQRLVEWLAAEGGESTTGLADHLVMGDQSWAEHFFPLQRVCWV
jgi:hypothetical protein